MSLVLSIFPGVGMINNGVPLSMGQALARAIDAALSERVQEVA